MRRTALLSLVVGVCLVGVFALQAQGQEAKPAVPRLVKFSGTLKDHLGKTLSRTIGVTFSIYADHEGGAALWMETQNVVADEQGLYTVLLGASKSEGLPLELFNTTGSRWLGVQVNLPGEVEQSRVLLVSVPYALKAADAETLGGKPASAFITTEQIPTETFLRAITAATNPAPLAASGVTTNGTQNFVGKFDATGTNLINSAVFENGGNVGIGTSNPARPLHIKSAAAAIRLEDSALPNSFWELQQSAFFVDTFGFLRYESGSAIEGKSFVVSNAGNMGLGTGNPQRKLHLKGPAAVIRLEDSNVPNSYWELQDSAFALDTFGFLRYENNVAVPSKSFVVTSAGNMGLGTTTPLAKLDVVGNVKASGQINANDGNFSGSVTATTGINTNSISNIGGNPITITTGNLQLGGGLTMPSGTLTVSGNINTSANINAGGGLSTNGGGGITINNGPLFVSSASANSVIAGNLNVNGTLSKPAGSFKIDHPLSPASKYLYHSFVESPDMMNIYNGVVKLDARGQAWVDLPDWFEALNRDFRYQLTAVGGPAPNLYIAQEIAGNRFKIAGGRPNGKVSWQVTGIRHDAYASAHRIPVEENKPPEEQGTYLHPELFGQLQSTSAEARPEESRTRALAASKRRK